MTIYKFSDEQFQNIQSALNAGIGMSMRFDTSMMAKFTDASNMMDDVANEEGEFKPFSTYPEDRSVMLSLSAKIESSGEHSQEFADAADKLADMVKAILEDEKSYLVDMDDGPSAA